MTARDYIEIACIFLAAIGGGGAIWARFKASSHTTALDIWRGEAEAQKARADRLEESMGDLARRVERLEIENAKLSELVTRTADLSAIRDTVADSHALLKQLMKIGADD